LQENEVHVWQADMDLVSPEIPGFDLLNDDEKVRAQRFAFDRDRNRFAIARSILRLILGRYLEKPPTAIKFNKGIAGKPALTCSSSLRFNLAHSEALVLLAFALNREIGIDVEHVRSNSLNAEVVSNYFSDREQQEFRQLAPELRDEAFYLGWTRKEAYLKARGEGLRAGLRSFDVSLNPHEPAVLTSDDAERWELHSLRPKAGFVGALVVKGRNCKIQCWQWQ
jgi:4'-phosphopantetheinyl transferase